MRRIAIFATLVAAACQPSEPAKDPQQTQHEKYERETRCRNALHWVAEGSEADWRTDRCDEIPALANLVTKARHKRDVAKRQEEMTSAEDEERQRAERERAAATPGPCEGAHMGVNDTWVGGRRRLANGWQETCAPNEVEIAAMPESAKRRLTEAEKKKIRERSREHFEEIRDQLDADAARRAQQQQGTPQPGQPVRVEVTGGPK
jgi:hypothetical protein